MKQRTPIKLDLAPNQVRAFNIRNSKNQVTAKTLSNLGISMDSAVMGDSARYFSLDAAPLQTTASITNPVQFFQYWAPEAIETITAARTIDEVFGRTIAGSFEDEEIVTTVLEKTGSARPYSDTANIPYASWNQAFDTRSIVRFEEGLEVGYLEAARASKMRIDTHRQKAEAVADSLAIELNNVGFFGYANGANKTYGLLNDPNLPAYVTVAQGVGNNTTWASKTFDEITADIITGVSQLVKNLKGHFKPKNDAFTMTVSLGCEQYLNKLNALGTQSVYQWLEATYPSLRIVLSPELDGANGGSNVFYLHTDKVTSKDTGKQYVQEALRLIGVEKKAKTTVEVYASATAGVVIQYPLAVVRYSGI